MSSVLRHRLLALLGGSALVIAVWLALPDSSAAPKTFARYEQPNLVIAAEPGTGFYGLEHSPKHLWAWSGGEATLVLHRLTSTGPAQPVSLRFYLQSLSPRTLTVRYGEFVLWKGDLNVHRVLVEIPSFTMTSPTAQLILTSDRPGELKPGGHDPRLLAFALYDLEISAAE